jgi:demethylmenaquinone methyltransferase/2-methoxy-6-polyprenyl-1,4-benzoquinol methylase
MNQDKQIIGNIESSVHRVNSSSRVIDSWANIYDIVNYFVFMIFGGGNNLRNEIADMAKLKEAKSVLDVGCGTGNLSLEIVRRLPFGGHVIGIDAGEKMVTLAKNKLHNAQSPIQFLRVSAGNISFKDEVFNCVFNVFLLHHLPMELKIAAFNEMYRVLKKGGELVTVDVDKPSNLLGKLIGLSRYHVKEIRDNMKTPLDSLLAEAGFKKIRILKRKWGIFSYIHAVKTGE